jgi:hypothetical protein
MTFEFAGFIIGNDKAEFAAQYESKLCTCEWVPTPELASTFTTARQANNAIKKLGNRTKSRCIGWRGKSFSNDLIRWHSYLRIDMKY